MLKFMLANCLSSVEVSIELKIIVDYFWIYTTVSYVSK